MSIDTSSEYLSREKLDSLEKELEYLTTAKRREISERLEESISLGDISENAEYQETKEQQLMNERRIAEIEDLLSRAVVIDETHRKIRANIEIGCFVVLQKMENDEPFEYQIVGSGDADPIERKISNESPLGESLLGRAKGEKVVVLTPSGKTEYTIIEIK
ncbi:MAG: transcription elongation factor GreA [Patescibacteria group bacterium]